MNGFNPASKAKRLKTQKRPKTKKSQNATEI
jgi:hypothetical protein